MKSFSSNEMRSAPALRNKQSYVHQPSGLAQQAQQKEIGRILRSTGVQTKLTVGQPNDRYEQEADKVADQVMTMPDPKLQRQPENEEEEEPVQAKLLQRQTENEEEEEMLQAKPLADQITLLVQRQEEPPEEEEEPVQAKLKDGGMIQRMCPGCEEEIAQRQPEENEDEELQAKSKPGKSSEVTPATYAGIQSLRGGGQSMSASDRSFFEPRFGADFSGVRVHNDERAAIAAKSVNARAFTLGKDVVFGRGEYSPDSSSGKKLFAHELTHVVQQNPAQRKANTSATPVLQGKAKHEQGRDFLQTKMGYGQALIQRDLATPPPAIPAPAQAVLTTAQIRSAIRYNQGRYNVVGTRLIQDLVGTKPTGSWVAADIRAIAAVQEEYGLSKDGRVGTRTFRFIDTEVRNERLRRTDANCLTSLFINRRAQNIVPRANGATMTRRFTMHAQFPRYCGCRHFEYRQFIRGHLRVRRGRVVHDQGTWFANLPAGRINSAWQEDGHTGAAALNYGHRTQPDEPINRYINDAGGLNMANGCRYEGDDTPGGNYSGWAGLNPTTGDEIDVNVNFRGEIRRRGRVIRSKRWSALRRRFRLP